MMQFSFDPNLEHQARAIEAACLVFKGQEIHDSTFSVVAPGSPSLLSGAGIDSLVGNSLGLSDEAILKNLQAIQLSNGLPLTQELKSKDFNIEMETGTGKTYVYLRTIFELNKRYGLKKFIVVVPSIAIKEGVYKSVQTTESHLKQFYSGVPFNYFIYDSSKPGQIDRFTASPGIQIMIVTVGAINKKDVNNLYKDNESTEGARPIDKIKAIKPVIIVDEPQSVDGGLAGEGRKALSEMNPLCTFRYSATHLNKEQMLYRLTAVDAYDRKLVKQIEVAAATVEEAHNTAYIRVEKIGSKKGVVYAALEVDTQAGAAVIRKTLLAHDGDSLEEMTGRSLYKGLKVGAINAKKGQETIELRKDGESTYLNAGQASGDADISQVHRQMISRTILEHFEKELRLNPLGIKVLSLFFIDSVEKYRAHNAAGEVALGEYGSFFEEEFCRHAANPRYKSLFKSNDHRQCAKQAHGGYFSIDKKGGWKNTSESSKSNQEEAERAYSLIMKDKESLLSFDSELKFIFSHSALREGWDNPNVFQICSLREMGSEKERRQTIGRGLRLSVNQQGQRQQGFQINTLTVIAKESYEEYAENLQKEMCEETGFRFGILESHDFSAIPVVLPNGDLAQAGRDFSLKVWTLLLNAQLIDSTGSIKPELKACVAAGAIPLSAEFTPYHGHILDVIRRRTGRVEIKNSAERKPVKTRKAVLDSGEFQALWDRIKHKTTYRVDFDNARMIRSCIDSLNKHLELSGIQRSRLNWTVAQIRIGLDGTEATVRSSNSTGLDQDSVLLPDILSTLQDSTQLTRRTLATILTAVNFSAHFKKNPQQFIEVASQVINDAKKLALVDGIKYQRIGDDDFYAQELFLDAEIMGYVSSMIESKKGVQDHVVYQSGTERDFAEQLERNDSVKVYAKLPSWFKVPTPLGYYIPDWAVLIEKNGVDKLYFVVETKSTTMGSALRPEEAAKIDCGLAHFSEIAKSHSNPAKFIKAKDINGVL